MSSKLSKKCLSYKTASLLDFKSNYTYRFENVSIDAAGNYVCIDAVF